MYVCELVRMNMQIKIVQLGQLLKVTYEMVF